MVGFVMLPRIKISYHNVSLSTFKFNSNNGTALYVMIRSNGMKHQMTFDWRLFQSDILLS